MSYGHDVSKTGIKWFRVSGTYYPELFINERAKKTFRPNPSNQIVVLRFTTPLHQGQDEHDAHLTANHDTDAVGIRGLQGDKGIYYKAVLEHGRVPVELLQGDNGKVVAQYTEGVRDSKVRKEETSIHPAS